MELRLLGPLELIGASGPVGLGGPKEKGVLVVLALSANTAVSESALIDAIWADDPPASALKVLQNNILRLRKTLRAVGMEPGLRIDKRAGGYALTVDPAALDVQAVDALARLAREAHDRNNPARAAALLVQALGMWRGPALAGLESLPFAPPVAASLAELRLVLLERRIDAELELGRHAELVAELHALTVAEPLRERFWAQRMLALQRSGRQAEALRAFQTVRRHLADELGLEPSPALVQLERDVAASSEALTAPRELPSGTVTFVVAEIDHAAQLLRTLGSRYPPLLAEYYELARSTFAEHGGVVVKREGDGLLAAFADAGDALLAVAECQERLHDGDGPVGGILKTRVGVQSGHALPVDGDYAALAAYHAARIAQAAAAGQSLVGAQTARQVGLRPPPPLGLMDLGSHGVRDFPAPEPLYQLSHPNLPSTFPALRSAASTAHNLPRFRTTFVGRQEEMAELASLLEQTGVVTVVGPGGVGKTRLAIEAGHVALVAYPDGVWLVDLADVSQPALVPDAVAATIGLPQQADTTTLDSLVAALRDRHLLVILDNCEHVIDAAAQVAERIALACPHVAILSTSRESLRIDGEVVWRLTPLAAPDPGTRMSLTEALGHSAVELLVDRARRAAQGMLLDETDVPALASIAWRLDGIPLALELVAARIGDLGVAAVAEAIDVAFPLLTAGRRTASPRHQTMHAAIAWGYELLSAREQVLLDRLAVFSGGFTSPASNAVCADGIEEPDAALEELVRRSLVVVDERRTGSRYRLLETVREFAVSQLEQREETGRIRARHLSWVAGLVTEATSRPDAEALAAIDAEIDNVREALRWAIGPGDPGGPANPAGGLELAAAVANYWSTRGRYREGTTYLSAALDACDPSAGTARARGLLGLATVCSNIDADRAVELFAEALDAFQEMGDQQGAFKALIGTCVSAARTGAAEVVETAATEALGMAEAMGNTVWRAQAIGHIAEVHEMRGDFDATRTFLHQELDLWTEVGDDRARAWALGRLGLLALRFGEFDVAEQRFSAMLDIARGLGYRGGEAWALCGLGQVAFDRGELGASDRAFAAAVDIHRELEIPLDAGWSFGGLARVRLASGRPGEARALLVEQVLALPGDTDGYGWPWHHLAYVNIADGRWADAVLLFAAAVGVAEGRKAAPVAERDVRERDVALTDLRRHLGDEAFTRIWARGQTLGRHEVNAIAVMPAPELIDEAAG